VGVYLPTWDWRLNSAIKGFEETRMESPSRRNLVGSKSVVPPANARNLLRRIERILLPARDRLQGEIKPDRAPIPELPCLNAAAGPLSASLDPSIRELVGQGHGPAGMPRLVLEASATRDIEAPPLVSTPLATDRGASDLHFKRPANVLRFWDGETSSAKAKPVKPVRTPCRAALRRGSE